MAFISLYCSHFIHKPDHLCTLELQVIYSLMLMISDHLFMAAVCVFLEPKSLICHLHS